MSEKVICPDCGARLREDGFNRYGWYWLECGRRYNPGRGTFAYRTNSCRFREAQQQLAEKDKEIERLRRPCLGCDCSIQDCYDYRRAGKIACCPDCNHSLAEQE